MDIKTSWNLGLMYTSPSDPKILKDVEVIEKSYDAFSKKYQKNKLYLKDSPALLQALLAYEKLDGLPNPAIYLHLLSDIESENTEAESLRNKVSQTLALASNKILFFKLSLGNIPPVRQRAFLKDKNLAKFHYLLKCIFIKSKYRLSEPEEKILNLKSLPAYDLWVQGQEKLLASKTISFKGKELSIGEAMNKIRNLPTKERRELHALARNLFKTLSPYAESEINAIVINKKINDELRGYEKPYSSTIIGYQNDEKSIENLIDAVSKHFHISHRFYKVKAKMLGLKKMEYSDRGAAAGKTSKKFPFKEGLLLTRKAFENLGKEYVGILDSYLKNGQIDAFPKKGKKSGAYCWGNINLPTYVLLNYTDDLNSVSTLAHEMGHAIHGEFSKTQPIIYQGHTISVAEVASTLFENFAFEEVFKMLSDEEKVMALHDRISDDIQTIFRQIACFNFEAELHLKIRERGSLPKEAIAELMNKHMKSYLGPVMEMHPDDGYNFVYWSHIRRFFYVYSYAYGQLISKALYKKYRENPSYLSKIEQFLKAGESMSPEDIWKTIGIDTTKPEFFIDGLKSINDDIARLEKLISRKNK